MRREEDIKFFTDLHKKLAYDNSPLSLMRKYKKSERVLKSVAKSGNEFELSRVMKLHGYYEYALLFQKTPEFLKGRKLK